MNVTLETVLPMAVEDVLDRLRTPALLKYVAAPVLMFVPIKPAVFPERWAEGEYRVALRLFGIIPLGTQVINISVSIEPDGNVTLRDNGRGDLAKRWDHRITIMPLDAQHSLYRDEVDVEAGLLTPFVWLFAQVFYRHRQRRWRQLARREAARPGAAPAVAQ